MRTVLSLCDRTGHMVQPWLDAGYRAVTVDLQRESNPHPLREHIEADVTKVSATLGADIGACIVFAFPPCSHLANSGARWFKDKGLEALASALNIVVACKTIAESSGAPWLIENPHGTLATYWREPDYAFDPCDYGDPYTKKTCVWCGGGFVMPPIVHPGDLFEEPTWVEPVLGSAIIKLSPSPDRANIRSETPRGFARAVFEANNTRLKP